MQLNADGPPPCYALGSEVRGPRSEARPPTQPPSSRGYLIRKIYGNHL